ncbi:MAG: hypothetical protein E7661_10195 [Ruminococcaceae bacterium]|nr:hypothetical protein [Oscillospiraceae bacterium]
MKVAKHLTLLAVLLALLALVACDLGDTKDKEDKDEETKKVTVAETEALDEETTAAHVHSYSAATCTKAGTCECGKTYGDPLGHDFADATCTTPKVCNRCGVAEGQSLSHDYVSATCTAPKTCSRCDLVVGEALGHDFTAANCTNPEICKRCELAQGSALGHDFAEATCTEPETCKVCGATGSAAMGHTYTDDTCIRCGEVDPDSLPVGLEELHLMDSDGYEVMDKVKDSFGNEHENGNVYVYGVYTGGPAGDSAKNERFSLHALSKQYTVFAGTIIARDLTASDAFFKVEIYVDDELKYSIEDFKNTTGAIDFSIDVSGGSSMKIVVTRNYERISAGLALVNAQLYK